MTQTLALNDSLIILCICESHDFLHPFPLSFLIESGEDVIKCDWDLAKLMAPANSKNCLGPTVTISGTILHDPLSADALEVRKVGARPCLSRSCPKVNARGAVWLVPWSHKEHRWAHALVVWT